MSAHSQIEVGVKPSDPPIRAGRAEERFGGENRPDILQTGMGRVRLLRHQDNAALTLQSRGQRFVRLRLPRTAKKRVEHNQ